MREAAIWRTRDLQSIRKYGPVQSLNIVEDLDQADAQTAVTAILHEIIEDLAQLDTHGTTAQAVPDGSFFVRRLRSAVDQHMPMVLREVTAIGQGPRSIELDKWAAQQGLSLVNVVETISKHATYRLFAQILFYFALRRVFSNVLGPISSDAATIITDIRARFADAAKIDYQAVFRIDPLLDGLSTPQSSAAILVRLVEQLERYDFSRLTQDVLGEVFEGLIPPEERHRLGQYFTDQTLARVITRLVLRDSKGTILDPTCGTGTFLLAGYDRLVTLGTSHADALRQIWGVDIAIFPAELATINLHRRDIFDHDAFPRVLVRDFSQLQPGEHVEVALARPDAFGASTTQIPFPTAQAIVGNLPFISFNDLVKYDPRATERLEIALARAWFPTHPELFSITPKFSADQIRRLDPKTLTVDQLRLIKPLLGGRSDYYVYLFALALRFMAADGATALITSTSWMDAGFAGDTETFLMSIANLRFVVASYVEPWFTTADVNVAVTGFEASGTTDNVNFVTLTKPLTEVSPQYENALYTATHDPSALQKQAEYRRIGVTTYSYPNVPLQVRQVRRSELKRSPKWIRFLRAPDVLFELEEEMYGRLRSLEAQGATVSRGIKTGLDSFFYLSQETATRYRIEPRYLVTVLKSPAPDVTPNIDDFSLAFLCAETKQELRRAGVTGALGYIEAGENRSTGRVPWPKTPSLQPRVSQGHPWYSLFTGGLTHVAVPLAFDILLRSHYSDAPMLLNQRLCRVSFPDPDDDILFAAYLNSSIGMLFIESYGRSALGQGALEMPADELSSKLPIPDMSLLRKERTAILAAFKRVRNRKCFEWITEAAADGRVELDDAVLRALGSKVSIDAIKAGVGGMIAARRAVAQARNTSRRGKVEKNYDAVLKRLISALPFGAGLRRFPDGFTGDATRMLLSDVHLADTHVAPPLFGHYEIRTNKGTLTLSRDEAAFALYALTAGSGFIATDYPDSPVATFESYLDDCIQQVRDEIHRSGFQEAAAALESDLLRELGLSEFMRWRSLLN